MAWCNASDSVLSRPNRYYAEEVVDMLFELKNTLRSTLAVSLMNG